ncbi:MAG TPA: alpha-hydroxy-acid oxidizing protein, partial [Puia sp.]|nr:alpha-hydroxy-acid oxidizing protein [Puia sp.]
MIQALDRQRAIFLQGLSGKRPILPFHADALRAMARKKMSARAWAYIDGGAGNEETIQSNDSAFSNVFIRPRMMHPNESADFSSTLLGTPLSFPVLLAPIGVLDLICPQADLHVARQCAATGV